MADILFLLLLAGFFAVAGLLVKGCERIIGPDQLPAVDPPAEAADAADRDPGAVAA